MSTCRNMILIGLLLAIAAYSQDPPAAGFDEASREKILQILTARLQSSMGEDWDRLLSEWKAELAAARTEAAYYEVLNRMLRSAGKSHFMLVSPALAKARDHQPTTDQTGTLGLTVSLVNGLAVVVRKEPWAAAAVEPGDAILRIDDWSPAPLIETIQESQLPDNRQWQLLSNAMAHRLAGPVGSRVELAVSTGDGKTEEIRLPRRKPAGDVIKLGRLPPWHMTFEKRWLADQRVGYIRFNVFMMPLLDKIHAAMDGFHEAHAVILDLRGNPGGLGLMAVPVASRFCSIRRSLGTSRLKESVVEYTVLPADRPFTGHLVILTDALTASTSEILAGGLQEEKRAIVVGSRTMGAVLPSLIVRLPNGAQMQYPIGDYRTAAGDLLEGIGVKPDIPVTLTRKQLYKDQDPVLAAAVDTVLDLPPRRAPGPAADDPAGEQALAVAPREPFPEKVEILLARHVAAMGGDAYRRVATLQAEGVLAIPGTGLRGDFTLLAKTPDLVRLDVHIEGYGRLQQGFDGRLGWSADPVMGNRQMTAAETAFTRQTAGLSLAADFRGTFASAQLLPPAELQRHTCEVVRFTHPNLPPLTAWFDQESGRIVRQKTKFKGPLGVFLVTTDLGNFRRFGDVRAPCRLHIRSGELEVALLITDVVLNQALDTVRFARPRSATQRP